MAFDVKIDEVQRKKIEEEVQRDHDDKVFTTSFIKMIGAWNIFENGVKPLLDVELVRGSNNVEYSPPPKRRSSTDANKPLPKRRKIGQSTAPASSGGPAT